MFVSADISTSKQQIRAPPSSEWTRLSDCSLGAECGVGKGKTSNLSGESWQTPPFQGIKVSITRDVSGCRAQPRLMCQAGHSSFAFLPPSLRAQSNQKIIRKPQTGGHPSGHNPVLPKAFRGQEKQRKTETLSQTREDRGDVTTEGKVVLGLKPRTERGH